MDGTIIFILGTIFGIALVVFISFIGITKVELKEKLKDNFAKDIFGRPKKSVIVKKEAPLDEILKDIK